MNLKELITRSNQRVSNDTEQVLRISSRHKFSGDVDRILDFIRENSSLLDDSDEELEKQFGSLKQALASRGPLSLKMTHGAIAFELQPETYNDNDAQDETAGPERNAEGDNTMNTDQEGEKNMAEGEEKNEQVNQQDIDEFFSDESDEKDSEGFSVSEDDIQNLLDETDPEKEGESSAEAEADAAPLSESEIDKIMNEESGNEGEAAVNEIEKLLEENADSDGGGGEAEAAESAADEDVSEEEPTLPAENGPEVASDTMLSDTAPKTEDGEKPAQAADDPKATDLPEADSEAAPEPEEAPLLEEHLAAGEGSAQEAPASVQEDVPAENSRETTGTEEEPVPAAEPVDESCPEEPSERSTEERIAGERFVLYVNIGNGPTQIAESQDKEDIKNAYLDALKKHSQNELFIERIVRKEVIVIREEKEAVTLSLKLTF